MSQTMSDPKTFPGDMTPAPAAYFILPHAEAGDTVQSLHIGADGRTTHHVSAEGVLRAFRDTEFWQKRAKETHDQLMNEMAKIRRLLNALADEVTKTA